MGFIKRHYEKILLSLVLLGLAAAAAILTFKVQGVKQELNKEKEALTPNNTAAVVLNDVEKFNTSLTLATNPPPIDLVNPHLLFNPVIWKRRADGILIPNKTGTNVGVGALTIVNIKPLLFRIKFDKVSGSPGRMRYSFEFDHQDGVDKNGRKIKPKSKYASVGRKIPGEWPFGDQTVALNFEEIQGEEAAPTGFVFGLTDANGNELKEKINFTLDAPYEEVRAHVADLHYKHTAVDYKGQRRGDKINVEGEDYNIVAISDKQVVLSAARNEKRTVIGLDPPPAAEQ
jgi:hypothetical protein